MSSRIISTYWGDGDDDDDNDADADDDDCDRDADNDDDVEYDDWIVKPKRATATN